MKKPKAKDAKAQPEAFERVVGGVGGEFTIVCRPAESGPDEERKPERGDVLVCKLVDVKDSRPAK